MSAVMDEEIKRWTARRKSALVLEEGRTAPSRYTATIKLLPGDLSALRVGLEAEQPGARVYTSTTVSL